MISREGVHQILTGGWPYLPFFAECGHLLHGRRKQDVHEDFWGFANVRKARGMNFGICKAAVSG
jgi:hypothetical protein